MITHNRQMSNAKK